MTPTRRTALGFMAAAAGSVALPGRVFASAKFKYDLQPKPAMSGVWMIEGATDYFSMQNGGAIVNCALLQGETGLILIDTGPSRRYAEELRLSVQALDLRGVSAVVNTHNHPDHYFGNQVFADKPIYGLGEMIELAITHGDSFSNNMYRLLGDWMRGTEPMPPTAALATGEVTIDGRKFLALPLAGHTETDLALLDTETGLLIAGDLAFLDRAPATTNANLETWQAALTELQALNAAAILPGHGPLDRSGASLAQTSAYLSWLETTFTEGANSGLDMVDLMDSPMPAEFAAMGAQPEEFHRSISHLFPDIERRELPRAN
ncbi:MAG: quinoprotein relay system zinc metallohydrolase 1 [Dinoroseobacter sp.]|nr:quinoprotein relay system zinc metallohydrolase 1 [Dinoroseobacter sp.]